MPMHLIAVDLFALLVALLGFHMAFRQALVRRLWRRLSGKPPAPPRPAAEADKDPAHYALIIFGMMMLAFGTILFAFMTAYQLAVD